MSNEPGRSDKGLRRHDDALETPLLDEPDRLLEARGASIARVTAYHGVVQEDDRVRLLLGGQQDANFRVEAGEKDGAALPELKHNVEDVVQILVHLGGVRLEAPFVHLGEHGVFQLDIEADVLGELLEQLPQRDEPIVDEVAARVALHVADRVVHCVFHALKHCVRHWVLTSAKRSALPAEWQTRARPLVPRQTTSRGIMMWVCLGVADGHPLCICHGVDRRIQPCLADRPVVVYDRHSITRHLNVELDEISTIVQCTFEG